MLKRLIPGLWLLCAACADKPSTVGVEQTAVPTSLTGLTSAYQTLRLGTVLHDTLVLPVVMVKDQFDHAMPNVRVTFTLRRGPTSQTIETDENGRARMLPWTIEPRAGRDTVVVTAGRVSTTFAIEVAAVTELAQYDLMGSGSAKLSFFSDGVLEPAIVPYVTTGPQIRWQIPGPGQRATNVVAQTLGDTLQLDYDDGRPRERYVMSRGISLSKNILQTAISDPVRTVTGSATDANAISDVVYVSFSAGQLGSAKTVRMRNVSTGVTGSAEHIVVAGGLDPVAIAANVGDTLEMILRDDGGLLVSMMAAVPKKRAPRVVRVDPPKGRTDVALNSKILVVFSEPIDPTTVTSGALSLTLGGQPVAGNFIFPNGPALVVQFAASAPLAPTANYIINVAPSIRDLTGDALEQGSTSDFTTRAATGAAQTGANVRITTTTTGDEIPSSYLATMYGVSAQPIPANGSATLENIPLKTQIPGISFYVILSGLPDHCSVITANPRALPLDLTAGQTVDIGFTILCEMRGPTTAVNTQQIAFVRGRDIFAVNTDGTNEIRITNTGENADPAWSPDGKRIAYSGERDGRWDIYTSNVDGTKEVRRTFSSPPWGTASRPAWSPDGTKIAFSTQCEGGQGCIRLSDDINHVTDVRIGHPQGNHIDAAWSPDGAKIAFVSDWDAYDFVFDIFVSTVDGSKIQQLTHGFGFWPDLHYYLHPTFSPDGSRIAFVYSTIINVSDQRWRLAMMNADGSGLTNLAFAGDIPWVQMQDPGRISWSPDGSRIAFSKVDCNMDPGKPPCTTLRSIRYVNVNGTGEGLLVTNGHSPSWRR